MKPSCMKIYGIKNCDTMKKATKWLDDLGASYEFHDYKKCGMSPELADELLGHISIDVLINKRGTTYRQLDDETKSAISNQDKSVAKSVMLENASVIKRPVLEHNGQYLVGFKADDYAAFTQ